MTTPYRENATPEDKWVDLPYVDLNEAPWYVKLFCRWRGHVFGNWIPFMYDAFATQQQSCGRCGRINTRINEGLRRSVRETIERHE